MKVDIVRKTDIGTNRSGCPLPADLIQTVNLGILLEGLPN